MIVGKYMGEVADHLSKELPGVCLVLQYCDPVVISVHWNYDHEIAVEFSIEAAGIESLIGKGVTPEEFAAESAKGMRHQAEQAVEKRKCQRPKRRRRRLRI